MIGDGKLGLLVGQALIVHKEVDQLIHFGRHQEKLKMVSGTQQVLVDDDTVTKYNQVVTRKHGSTVTFECDGRCALPRPFAHMLLCCNYTNSAIVTGAWLLFMIYLADTCSQHYNSRSDRHLSDDDDHCHHAIL